MELSSSSFEYFHIKSSEPLDLEALKTDLSSLLVMGLPLFDIPYFQALNNLTDLWLVGCSLCIADKLKCGLFLQNLHLSSNSLTKIPDLSSLRNLKVLWLNQNLIEKINEGELPPTLEELNVADNRISYIGNSFQMCSSLETLNLSKNPIASIFEFHHLQKLEQLKYLWLCDPRHYMASCATLINYRSFIINYFPNLRQLDSHVIEERESDLIKVYFINKRNHYKMLSMNAMYDHYINQKDNYKNATCELMKLRKNQHVLSLNKEQAKEKGNENTLNSCKKMQKFLKCQIEDWEKKWVRAENQLEELKELKLRYLEIELEYFGNIKFRTHNKNSDLARTCEKILNSKCSYLKAVIESIEVDLVTQVVRSGNTSLTAPIFEDEFDPQEGEQQEGNPSVVILCDPLWVQNSYEPFFNYIQQSIFFQEGNRAKYTVSQCIANADSLLNKAEYIVHPGSDEIEKRIVSVVFTDQDTWQAPKEEVLSCNKSDEHICKPLSMPFNLVTNPMLLVQFHYNLKKENSLTQAETLLIEGEPYLPSQYAAESFFSKYKSWENLVILEIVKLNLTSFGLTTPLHSIKELDVSYNRLNNMTEICQIFPNLVTLRASFNNIFCAPVNYEMVHLKHIDLSWNLMKSLKDILKWIKIKASQTETLNLKFNLFNDVNERSHEILMVAETLPNLFIYNNMNLKNATFEMARDRCTIEDLSSFQLINQSEEYTTQNCMEQFKLSEENRDCCPKHSRKTHVTVNNRERITCLYLLKDQQCHDLTFLQPLNEVRSCTIRNNKLREVSFLLAMNDLKHLNLSYNLLESLGRNFFSLSNLVTLNLSSNYITSLEELKNVDFPNLKILDVSKNSLQKCCGIEGIKNIEEMNISFNKISELDRFLFLKQYRKLKIIDMRENGVEHIDILKRYLIYHVRSLEYINGSLMTESEIANAHQAIGGVLDLEYLESVHKNQDILKLKHLNLVNSSIKMVSLNSVNLLNLVSLNLENNTLQSIAELLILQNLKFLSLGRNQILKFGDARQSDRAIFTKLEELHLNKNGISDLEPLQFHKMPNLKTLFLQDNQITSFKGIEQLTCLRHLILDRNKIRTVNPYEVRKMIKLKDLYLESNHIQKLDFLRFLKRINRLFLKNNMIENIETLKFLEYLTKIKEITFSGNPICRRYESYHKVLSYLPNISYVDGFLIDRESSNAVDSSLIS